MHIPEATDMVKLEAELRVPVATVQLARFLNTGPIDNVLWETDTFWLDLCLTPRPRNARACYSEHWSPHRFEPIGTLFAVPPGETMQARADGGSPQTSLLCHLRPEPVREWFQGDLEWTDRRLEASLDIPDAGVRQLLLRMVEELRHPGFASEVLVELMAMQVAIELSRYWLAIKDGPSTGGLSAWRLRVIDERLREVARTPSLSELAHLCKLSVRQLTRGFRASRNRSIGDHVAQSRIDQAKRLLASGESIRAISRTLGFASASSFCVAFRRATGETPRQFRHRIPRVEQVS
jgi:AraC family transcriptional regulator